MRRTREWLRSFLSLGARSTSDSVSPVEIGRQEDTVLRALELLEHEPGVLIADEVGMGKTFEAMGVVAAFRHVAPNSRVVILAPGRDLVTKWRKEFEKFSDATRPIYNFATDFGSAYSLGDFVREARTKRIVIAPVTAFIGPRSASDQQYLLSLFFDWKELHGLTVNAILNRFREGQLERVDPRTSRFMDVLEYSAIRAHVASAFLGDHGLNQLFEKGGLAGFEDDEAVRKALDFARFRLVRALLPELDLLVIDEAHRLKNAETGRSIAVHEIFKRKYNNALFLTATPFQLHVNELRQIFRTFGEAKKVPEDYAAGVERLFADIASYQSTYNDLQSAWSRLDAVGAAEFQRLYAADPGLVGPFADPLIRDVARQVSAILKLKTERIEPSFRRWVIRSLRLEKRQYRRHDRRALPASGEAALPFLLYERFIAELFRSEDGTHKAAVQINMVSSHAAARDGALIGEGGRKLGAEAESYRELLRGVLDDMDRAPVAHPKLDHVLNDALEAAVRGEKTLIFCARIATLTELSRRLREAWDERLLTRWMRVFPGATPRDIFNEKDGGSVSKGRHTLLQARFHRTSDLLFLALRERYLTTLAPGAMATARSDLPKVVSLANRKLQTLRLEKSKAERLDYSVAKRCVEQAAMELWKNASPPTEGSSRRQIEHILDPRFLTYGIDLKLDDLESDAVGPHSPQWKIDERVAAAMIDARPSLWTHLAPQLEPLDLDKRVQVVERVARYLTFKEVPFLIDLLAYAKDLGQSVEEIESRQLLPIVDCFWDAPQGRTWLERLRTFVTYFVTRNEEQQNDLLEDALQEIRLVRHTQEASSREKLREAFNTPLYPMILIANEVMHEGVDLHRQCRRIVHHDLAWNPAALEQRVGRIDRLGSYVQQLRERGPEEKLDVIYPLIERTIDEHMFRVVKGREKWLEFLLGAPPDFAEYAVPGETAIPLPEALANSLAIDLRPPPAEESRRATGAYAG